MTLSSIDRWMPGVQQTATPRATDLGPARGRYREKDAITNKTRTTALINAVIRTHSGNRSRDPASSFQSQ